MSKKSTKSFKVGIVGAGLVAESFRTGNTRTKLDLPKKDSKDSSKFLDIPKDLAFLMQKWNKLPKEIKKTILSLVKHCARSEKARG